MLSNCELFIAERVATDIASAHNTPKPPKTIRLPMGDPADHEGARLANAYFGARQRGIDSPEYMRCLTAFAKYYF